MKLLLDPYPVVFVYIALLGGLVLTEPVGAQTIRPLSKNWYRVPYADGTEIQINPTNTLFNGHNGHDLGARPFIGFPSPYTIVAAAAGTVVKVRDSRNLCDTASGCNNDIWIAHDNGEFSSYYHIAFESALVDSGDVVSAGDPIATEGDVGATTGTGPPNRERLGCDGAPPSYGFCGIHLHFAVSPVFDNQDASIILNPRICGLADLGYVLLAGGNIASEDVGDCDQSSCPDDLLIAGSWSDQIEVIQSSSWISTGGKSNIIDNSVIGFQAQESITLNPGFHALSGSYFRAEIGACNGGSNRKARGSSEVSEHLPTPEQQSLAGETIPTEFGLSQNYPNPFNPSTTIRYALKEDVQVRLSVYDILGRKVRTLVDEFQPASFREVMWNGKNDQGMGVAGGVYFYRLTAGNYVNLSKMVMLD
jgi:murein DD-endopeptidase MepM/ murein hydrolase activator NlpD